MIKTLAFDADDTLWQNEQFFRLTEKEFQSLLSDHADEKVLAEKLQDTERKNLKTYGFGIKGFTLSMIETALQVTDGRVPTNVIGKILGIGRELLSHPMELMPGVTDVLNRVAPDYDLFLITKGDLFDQERKIAHSGLADYFQAIEIVHDKNETTYRRIFDQRGVQAADAMMVGNSMKSDVLPVLNLGSWGVYVPHDMNWVMEHAEAPADHPRFRQIDKLTDLPAVLDQIT